MKTKDVTVGVTMNRQQVAGLVERLVYAMAVDHMDPRIMLKIEIEGTPEDWDGTEAKYAILTVGSHQPRHFQMVYRSDEWPA